MRALATWADLASLGIIPSAAAAIAFAFGLPSQAFLVILGSSLMLNAVLAMTSIRYRRRMLRGESYARRMQEVLSRPTAFAVENAQPSSWLADPTDLGTLALDAAVLESSYVSALEAARGSVGPDARLQLVDIALMPSVRILFRALSDNALKFAAVTVTPEETVAMAPSRESGPFGRTKEEALWRKNNRWQELVQRSWDRERPFVGSVVLVPSLRSTCGWEVIFVRLAEIDEPAVRYTLDDDELVRLKS